MIAKMHKLSFPAQQAIAELKQRGIAPTIDEIVTLHEYGKQIEQPEPHAPALDGWPVAVGGVVLHPWTIGAWLWWSQCARPCFPDDSDISVLVYAFAMAHGHDLDVLQPLVTFRQIKKAVTQWGRGLDATAQELVSAINLLHRTPSESSTQDGGDGAADDAALDGLVDWLVSEHGQSREYWMWSASLSYALRLCERHKQRQRGKDDAPDPNAPIVVATGRLRRVVSMIIEDREHA